MNLRVVLLAAGLAVVGVAIAAYKVFALGYELVPQAAEDRWAVQMQLRLEGSGDAAKVRFFLPVDRPDQRVYDERVLAEGMRFYIRPKDHNRVGYLRARFNGRNLVSYRFSVHLAPQAQALPSPEEVNEAARQEKVDPEYLAPSKSIQSDDDRIRARLREITAPGASRLDVVRAIYNYLADEVPTVDGTERSDALTVLQKERGGDLGKARLFTALARAAGIPARVSGGFDLVEGSSDVRYWADVHLAGHWYPMDPITGRYGVLPVHRLVLFEGDRSLLSTHGVEAASVRITAMKEEVSQHRVYERKVRRSNAFLDRISLFNVPVRSQLTLRLLLLIPFGALVVAVFRNLIGVPTFGTFMPVLVALAFLETSLLYGIVFMLAIVAVGWVFRALLDRLQLLMVPRLAFLLTVVILIIAGISLLSEKLGFGSGLSVSLFPVVILTMTIERFSIMIVEEGTRNALKTTAGTIFVSATTFAVLGNETLQRTVLAFPELLLPVMGILVILGRYTGYRLSEWTRFAAFRAGSGHPS